MPKGQEGRGQSSHLLVISSHLVLQPLTDEISHPYPHFSFMYNGIGNMEACVLRFSLSMLTRDDISPSKK